MSWRNLILFTLKFHIFTCVIYYITSLFYKPVGAPILASAYHWEHPYFFISVFSLTLFFNLIILKKGAYSKIILKPILFYSLFYTLWMTLSLVLSGGLWSFFDMQSGWFPEFPEIINKLFEDMFYGLILGSLFVLCSMPFNIIVLIYSYYNLKKLLSK